MRRMVLFADPGVGAAEVAVGSVDNGKLPPNISTAPPSHLTTATPANKARVRWGLFLIAHSIPNSSRAPPAENSILCLEIRHFVCSIPFVLLTLGLILSLFWTRLSYLYEIALCYLQLKCMNEISTIFKIPQNVWLSIVTHCKILILLVKSTSLSESGCGASSLFLRCKDFENASYWNLNLCPEMTEQRHQGRWVPSVSVILGWVKTEKGGIAADNAVNDRSQPVRHQDYSPPRTSLPISTQCPLEPCCCCCCCFGGN